MRSEATVVDDGSDKAIGRKLAVLIGGSLAAALIVSGGFSALQALGRYVDQKHQSLVATAQVFAAATAGPARRGDPVAALEAMRAIARIPLLVHARVESDGRVLAALGSVPQLDGDPKIAAGGAAPQALDVMRSRTIEASAPIVESGETIGRFVLVARTDDLLAPIPAALASIAAASGVALLAGLAVARRIRRSVVDPALRLLATLGRYAASREVRRLAAAIDAGEIVPYYQPIMDQAGRETDGFEVLVRWRRSDGRFVPPMEFVPLAEAGGLIGRLGDAVLRHACRDFAAWPDLRCNFNVSSLQVQTRGFARRFLAIVEEEGFDPRRMVAEITETALIGDDVTVRRELDELRRAGVAIALDDFGTGFSNLVYLRRFQFDEIKIDKSFVDAVDRDEEAAAIVRAVVSMAAAFGMRVVAEGVERVEQHRFLEAAGVDLMQGYLFGQPRSAAEITAGPRRAGSIAA